MNEQYWLAPDANHDERAAFGSLKLTAAARGEPINDSRISHLTRVTLGNRRYYVKVYHFAGSNLRRYVGRSRVRAEWHNQRLFGSFGVPSARIVAFGERRGLMASHQGVIVTEEVANSVDLFELVARHPDRLADEIWMGRVIDRLADHVRSMHAHHFVHNDLKWRNVLVDFSRQPEVYIIDCPLGRRLFGPLLERGIVKDLACLDRVARRHLSRRQRVRFYKRYQRVDRLDSTHRRRITRVLQFFEGRETASVANR